MHYLSGIIIPKEDVEGMTEEEIGNLNLNIYLEEFSEHYEVEPYIEQTKEEYEKEFENWKKELQKRIDKPNPKKPIQDYEEKYIENGKIKKMTAKEWVKSWKGDELFDENDNILTTWNKNSFYDWYSVGGRWDKELNGKNILKVSEVLRYFKLKEGIGLNDEEKGLNVLRKLSNEEKGYNEFFVHYLAFDDKWEMFDKWDKTENQIKKDIKKYLKILEKHKEDYFIVIDVHN